MISKNLVESDIIRSHIYSIRGVQVMTDNVLAEMYGVETKQINRAVKRNIARFPPDFMFQLTEIEWNNLRSQVGTLKIETQSDLC